MVNMILPHGVEQCRGFCCGGLGGVDKLIALVDKIEKVDKVDRVDKVEKKGQIFTCFINSINLSTPLNNKTPQMRGFIIELFQLIKSISQSKLTLPS